MNLPVQVFQRCFREATLEMQQKFPDQALEDLLELPNRREFFWVVMRQEAALCGYVQTNNDDPTSWIRVFK